MPFYSLQVYAIVVEVGEKTLQSDHEILGTACFHIKNKALDFKTCLAFLYRSIDRHQFFEKAVFDFSIRKAENYIVESVALGFNSQISALI